MVLFRCPRERVGHCSLPHKGIRSERTSWLLHRTSPPYIEDPIVRHKIRQLMSSWCDGVQRARRLAHSVSSRSITGHHPEARKFTAPFRCVKIIRSTWRSGLSSSRSSRGLSRRMSLRLTGSTFHARSVIQETLPAYLTLVAFPGFVIYLANSCYPVESWLRTETLTFSTKKRWNS